MRSALAAALVVAVAVGVEAQRLAVVDLLGDTVTFLGPSLDDVQAEHAEGYDVQQHPSGRFAVISRPALNEITFYDLRDATARLSEPSIAHAAWTMAFTPDGSCLVSTGPETVSSYAVGPRQLVSDVAPGYSTSALAVVAPNLVFVGDTNARRIVVLSVRLDDCVLGDTGQAVPVSGETTSDPVHLAVSPDGSLVAAVNRTAGIDLFRVDGSALVPAGHVVHPPGTTALSAAFLPDGTRLYVHHSTFIRILDVGPGGTMVDSGQRIDVGGLGVVGLPGPHQILTDDKLVYFTVRGGVVAARVDTGEIVARSATGSNPVALALSGSLAVASAGAAGPAD